MCNDGQYRVFLTHCGLKQSDDKVVEKNTVTNYQSPTVTGGGHIYGTLQANEFRLIRLTAAQNLLHPIHLSLETYPHDNCVEYEATSYTWGGENNDATACQPIYIGSAWNVLLQTRNCWSMLRYLRPQRGVRMVWIDAICINQSNPREQSAHVAMMGAIYRRCMRVVVYLGDDMVDVTTRQRPRRTFVEHEIQQRAKNSPSTLKALLERRYFSRVWIIQELLLSPSAIFPIQDVDLLAGPTLGQDLKHCFDEWDWSLTRRPWMQGFAQGGSFQGLGFLDALRLTWSADATNGCDKVFGVLGLLRQDEESRHLQPVPGVIHSDFEIITGAFAHVLFHHDGLALLSNAAGAGAVSPYPSWMPDWQSSSMWSYSQEEPTLDDFNRLHKWYRDGARELLLGHNDSSSISAEENCILYQVLGCREEMRDKAVNEHIGAQTSPTESTLWINSIEYRKSLRGAYEDARYDEIDSSREIASQRLGPFGVEASTACPALCMRLIHVLRLPCRPVLRFSTHNTRLFEFLLGRQSLFICVGKFPLDKLLPDESFHLFFLERLNDERPCALDMLFFVRETEASGTYNLLFSCPCYHMTLARIMRPDDKDYARLCPKYQGFHQLFPTVLRKKLRTYWNFPRPFENLYEILRKVDSKTKLRELRTKSIWELKPLSIFFPGRDTTWRDIFPILQALFQFKAWVPPGLWEESDWKELPLPQWDDYGTYRPGVPSTAHTAYLGVLHRTCGAFRPENEPISKTEDTLFSSRGSRRAPISVKVDSYITFTFSSSQWALHRKFLPDLHGWGCSRGQRKLFRKEKFENITQNEPSWIHSSNNLEAPSIVRLRRPLSVIIRAIYKESRELLESDQLDKLRSFEDVTKESALDLAMRGPQQMDKRVMVQCWGSQTVEETGIDTDVRRVRII